MSNYERLTDEELSDLVNSWYWNAATHRDELTLVAHLAREVRSWRAMYAAAVEAGARIPDPTAETLPNAQDCYPLCACVKCSTDGPSTVHGLDPNPYRADVAVDSFMVYADNLIAAHREWYVTIRMAGRGLGGFPIDVAGPFPTKEEADTHAALILAALHEAVME